MTTPLKKIVRLPNPERFQLLMDLASIAHEQAEMSSSGIVDSATLISSLGMLRMLVTEMEEMIYRAFGDVETIPVTEAKNELIEWLSVRVGGPGHVAMSEELVNKLIDACYLRKQRLSDEAIRRIVEPPPSKDFIRPMGVPKNVH